MNMEELNLSSMEEILLYAINQENEAGLFYAKEAKRTSKIELKMIWEQLSHDEVRHKAILSSLLENLKEEDQQISYSSKEVTNYTAIDIPEKEYTDIENAIILAINNENDAYFLYKHLADKVSNLTHKKVLETLAYEELKHRESLVIELNA